MKSIILKFKVLFESGKFTFENRVTRSWPSQSGIFYTIQVKSDLFYTVMLTLVVPTRDNPGSTWTDGNLFDNVHVDPKKKIQLNV